MQKDGLYVSFQSVDIGVNSDISVGEDGLRLDECVFRKNYSFLYFCVASGVIVKSKYLKVPTCFILSPLQRMLHTGMYDCFLR